MDRVTKTLFMLLRSQICEGVFDMELARSVVENQDDFANLYSLSNHHDLAHIVGAALDANDLLIDSSNIAESFKRQYFTAVYRYKRIEYELSELLRVLNDAKIDHIPLKGSVIRKYYPAPWMRTSCDIDILVHESDLERAADLLVNELNYTETGRCSHDIEFSAESGVHVELHYDLIEESINLRANEVLGDVWNFTFPVFGEHTLGMADQMFYFYHSAHMAKHFMNGGCGIKPFIDQWILAYKVEHDDSARRNLLERGGLLEFDKGAQELADAWLSGDEYCEETEIMEMMVLTGGTYGVMENMVSLQQAQRGGKVRYAISRILLPYNVLKFKYPILKKHKWLTPIFEVVRWFGLVFGGGLKRSTRELKRNARVSESEAMASEKLLKKLGLI